MYYPANQNSVPQPADTKKKTTAHALSFAAFLLLLQSFTDVTNTSLSYRESGLGDSWVPPTHNLAGSLDFLSGFAKFGDSDLQTVTGYPLAYHTLDDEEEEARRLAADDDGCATMSHQSHEDEFMEIAPIDADHSQHHDHHRHQSSSSSNSAVTPRSRNETAIETLDSMTTEEIVDFLQYVPAHQVNQVRNAHPNLQAAAQWVVPTPFGPGGPSFVRWTSAFEPVAVEPNAPPVPFWWSCANCSNYSDNHQFCTSCNSKIEVTACRVFLGQLRKQASAESVARMIAHLCPGVVPLHIESHNNKGGHEKGCAWVYLHTPADCDALIALHKRVYFDSDLNGYEGFWVADVDQSTHLCNFADERKADPNRSALLPRQPIVAEYPMSSMLRTVAARQRSQAFAEPLGANWAPRGNGWFGAAPVDRQAM